MVGNLVYQYQLYLDNYRRTGYNRTESRYNREVIIMRQKIRPNNLQKARHEAGLSQSQVARRAGCATQTVRKIEYGWRLPRVDLAVRLARAVGKPVEEVFPTPDPDQAAAEGRVYSE